MSSAGTALTEGLPSDVAQPLEATGPTTGHRHPDADFALDPHGRRVTIPPVQFFRVYPEAPRPRSADASIGGSIPARAHHYCLPFTTASGFGWHLFPPIAFDLLWDGNRTHWREGGGERWHRLGYAALPGLREAWSAASPLASQLPSPPAFLHGAREPGIVQVWSGYVARTEPGWSLIVRGPVNFPADPNFQVLEGVIETDWWRGPLITNLRLTRPGVEVQLVPEVAMLQIQPVPRAAYSGFSGTPSTVLTHQLDDRSWAEYAAVMVPRNAVDRRPGFYKATVAARMRDVHSSSRDT